MTTYNEYCREDLIAELENKVYQLKRSNEIIRETSAEVGLVRGELQNVIDNTRTELSGVTSQLDAALAELAKVREERDKSNQIAAALRESYNYAVRSNQEQFLELEKKDEEIRNHISSKNGWLCKYNETQIDLADCRETLLSLQRENEALRKTVAMAAELLSDSAKPFDEARVLLRKHLPNL